jgi:hypothetical protein
MGAGVRVDQSSLAAPAAAEGLAISTRLSTLSLRRPSRNKVFAVFLREQHAA